MMLVLNHIMGAKLDVHISRLVQTLDVRVL